MITTNFYRYFITSLLDVSEEIEISDTEFSDLCNFFRSDLKPEFGATYKKYWILDNGKDTGHYLVKRLVGFKTIV